MLADVLLSAGLLQFGRFAKDGEWQPYRLNLELLPSYPDILAHIVDIGTPLIGPVDHLVCPLDALPFGVALSQSTSIPLVYSQSNALAGAYDIGHPALLVANQLNRPDELEHLISYARRVGLEINQALIIVNEGWSTLRGVKVEALLDLPELIQILTQHELIPVGQGRTVLDWISLRRPESGAP
jgi:orotate phosphoribosyltransferase